MSNTPANFETRKDFRIVRNIAIQRTMISIKAKNGDFKPKNRIDQSMFRPSWTANQNMAVFTPGKCRVFSHRRKREIPMRTNRLIHTGEKTQLGGVKDGLAREAYQTGMEGVVNSDPTNPAS